ncbi:MAG: hypothetical protein FWC68_05280 [Oscillospiraceae bacterium]|nr:hypothetical protein [Oscillospiraceae bacterium]
MKITYEENILETKPGTRVNELLAQEIEQAPVQIIACKINNEIKRLNHILEADCDLELINIGTKDGMRIYRRGLIYIVTKAFSEVYPESLFRVNYQLHHALLCEIDNMEITEEVVEKVNNRVQEIIAEDLPIIRRTMTKQEATEFYEKEKTLKGILQLCAKDKSEITLYYCEDYYNYFYGILPVSTGYIKQYELKKYHDGFLIRFPSSKSPTVLDEFKASPKLLETLDQHEDVHKILNLDTLYKLNKSIREEKIRETILLDEALQEKNLVGIADSIVANKDIKVVLIAGPSSSGKTTFSKRLEIQLKLNKISPLTISVDNYFVPRDETPLGEDGKFDFESIRAVNTELLNEHLLKLLNGDEIEAPTYNFHTRTNRIQRQHNEVRRRTSFSNGRNPLLK